MILMKIKVLTIGVYGFDEAGFFQTLANAGVNTFCDIRARRGMRGSEYRFANSTYLQNRLQELGIRYFHFKNLAPTEAIRDVERENDKKLKIAKRKRTTLSEGYIQAFRSEVLSNFDAESLMKELGAETRTMAFFCVERDPQACHRLLVAQEFARQMGVEVEHLMP
jgi:uncharacterized protein (DUF488 family)